MFSNLRCLDLSLCSQFDVELAPWVETLLDSVSNPNFVTDVYLECGVYDDWGRLAELIDSGFSAQSLRNYAPSRYWGAVHCQNYRPGISLALLQRASFMQQRRQHIGGMMRMDMKTIFRPSIQSSRGCTTIRSTPEGTRRLRLFSRTIPCDIL